MKMYIYLAHVGLTVGIALFLLFMGGMSFNPLFIPVNSFIYFVVLMILVIMVESFFFKNLEITYNPSDSRKILMIKTTIFRSFIVLVIFAIIGMIFFLPMLEDSLISSATEEQTITESSDSVEFTSMDKWGLTKVTTITVTAETQGEGTVYILAKDDFDKGKYSNALNFDRKADPSMEYTQTTEGYGQYVIFLRDWTPDETSPVLRTEFEAEMSDTFTLWVPLLFFAVAGANAGWISYLFTMRKRYSGQSIYA